MFTKRWGGTEPGCMHPDYASCGDDCQILHGEGFAETMYDMEARTNYNETHPNHFRSGIGSSFKKRTALIFCRAEIPPVNPVFINKINEKTICGTRGGKNFE